MVTWQVAIIGANNWLTIGFGLAHNLLISGLQLAYMAYLWPIIGFHLAFNKLTRSLYGLTFGLSLAHYGLWPAYNWLAIDVLAILGDGFVVSCLFGL